MEDFTMPPDKFLEILLDTRKTVNSIEQKLDAHLTAYTEARAENVTFKTATDNRLQRLEVRYNGFIAGVALAIVGVTAKFAGVFG